MTSRPRQRDRRTSPDADAMMRLRAGKAKCSQKGDGRTEGFLAMVTGCSLVGWASAHADLSDT